MLRERGPYYSRALFAILAAAFLVRLLVAVAVPSRPVSDFLEYFRLANSIVQTGHYEVLPGIPASIHPPGYPLLLSLSFRLVRPADELGAAKLTNIGLAVLTCLIGATLGRRFWGDSAGLWTATWLAFLPRSLLMSDLIASENLFSPLLLLFLLLCAASWTDCPDPRREVAIGIVVGLLTLTRSVAYFLPAIWLLGSLAARRRGRIIIRGLVLILALEHAVLLPWAIRNAHALGRFTFLNTVGGVGLFIANHPHADAGWDPNWVAELERLRPGTYARGRLAVDDAARQEAWRWIRENPARAAALYFQRVWVIATNDSIVADFAIFGETTEPPDFPGPVLPGPHALKIHVAAVRAVLRASGLLLAGCALGGLAILLRRTLSGSRVDGLLALGFCATALYIPLLSSAIAVNGRYRWPTEDVIAPLAGLLVARIPTLFHRSSLARPS